MEYMFLLVHIYLYGSIEEEIRGNDRCLLVLAYRFEKPKAGDNNYYLGL